MAIVDSSHAEECRCRAGDEADVRLTRYRNRLVTGRSRQTRRSVRGARLHQTADRDEDVLADDADLLSIERMNFVYSVRRLPSITSATT